MENEVKKLQRSVILMYISMFIYGLLLLDGSPSLPFLVDQILVDQKILGISFFFYAIYCVKKFIDILSLSLALQIKKSLI